MICRHFFSAHNRIIALILVSAMLLTACEMAPFKKSTVPEGYGNLGDEKAQEAILPCALCPLSPPQPQVQMTLR